MIYRIGTGNVSFLWSATRQAGGAGRRWKEAGRRWAGGRRVRGEEEGVPVSSGDVIDQRRSANYSKNNLTALRHSITHSAPLYMFRLRRLPRFACGRHAHCLMPPSALPRYLLFYAFLAALPTTAYVVACLPYIPYTYRATRREPFRHAVPSPLASALPSTTCAACAIYLPLPPTFHLPVDHTLAYACHHCQNSPASATHALYFLFIPLVTNLPCCADAPSYCRCRLCYAFPATSTYLRHHAR